MVETESTCRKSILQPYNPKKRELGDIEWIVDFWPIALISHVYASLQTSSLSPPPHQLGTFSESHVLLVVVTNKELDGLQIFC